MNKKNTSTEIKIYTDGSCLKNPGGPGGIGCVLLADGNAEEISTGYPAPADGPPLTSNRIEMLACIEALESLKEPSNVTLYSDSKFVVNCAQRLWKRKANLDLWERLNPLLEIHTVKFKWVKSHASNRWNNRCDELARLAAWKVDHSLN